MSRGRLGRSGSEIIHLWDKAEPFASNRYYREESDAIGLTSPRGPHYLNEGRRCLQRQGNTRRKDPPNGHEEEGSSPCLSAQHKRKYTTVYQT